MKYPTNDLWTVRSTDLLDGALEDMRGNTASYYPGKVYSLTIPGVMDYQFRGVLNFDEHDRLIMFEQGDDFGLTRNDILPYLKKYGIRFTELAE